MRKPVWLICSIVALVITQAGCVSAWMATSTGTTIGFPAGTTRAVVLAKLGSPKERRSDVSPAARNHFSRQRQAISFVEVFEYRGKINSNDEGGGQATINALTLGVGEIFMIPMTAADIAKRSTETNLIYVFFDAEEKVVGFMVNPTRRYQPNPPVPTRGNGT